MPSACSTYSCCRIEKHKLQCFHPVDTTLGLFCYFCANSLHPTTKSAMCFLSGCLPWSLYYCGCCSCCGYAGVQARFQPSQTEPDNRGTDTGPIPEFELPIQPPAPPKPHTALWNVQLYITPVSKTPAGVPCEQKASWRLLPCCSASIPASCMCISWCCSSSSEFTKRLPHSRHW